MEVWVGASQDLCRGHRRVCKAGQRESGTQVVQFCAPLRVEMDSTYFLRLTFRAATIPAPSAPSMSIDAGSGTTVTVISSTSTPPS